MKIYKLRNKISGEYFSKDRWSRFTDKPTKIRTWNRLGDLKLTISNHTENNRYGNYGSKIFKIEDLEVIEIEISETIISTTWAPTVIEESNRKKQEKEKKRQDEYEKRQTELRKEEYLKLKQEFDK